MHLRGFAALLLGAWLAGCLFMDMVATENFRAVDRLLTAPSPPLAQRIQAMGGHDVVRVLLRHQASEENRWYFTSWEQVQIGFGVALFSVLLFGNLPDRRMLLVPLLVLLGIVLLMHFLLTPEITRLGRAIDFVPAGTPSADRTRFWRFHGMYSASELIKLGLVIALSVLLMRQNKQKPPDQVQQAEQAGMPVPPSH
jgi:hypothetical protein